MQLKTVSWKVWAIVAGVVGLGGGWVWAAPLLTPPPPNPLEALEPPPPMAQPPLPPPEGPPPEGSPPGPPPEGSQRPWFGQRRRHLLQELNLSAAQVQQMKQIRDRYQSQIQQKQGELQQAHEQLRRSMTGDVPKAQLEKQFRQVQSLHQELGNLRFQSMLEIREVLTLEQRNQFAQRFEEEQPMGRPRRDRGGRF